MTSSLSVLFTLLLAAAFLVTPFALHLRHDMAQPNHCTMTYMRPNYRQVPVANATTKYALYRYLEGVHRPGAPFPAPAGQPVLFIPGNAGTRGQVRSLAAESARAHSKRPLGNYADSHVVNAHLGQVNWRHDAIHELDWYTLDLNEELVAFSGHLLWHQVLFANNAIRSLLALYQHLPHVKHVYVVAHSMGGIVARALPLATNYLPDSVPFVITLATPHLAPPLLVDHRLHHIYQRLPSLPPTPVLSISGGLRDQLIDARLSHLPNASNAHFALTESVSTMLQLQNDHLSILWCNQVVLRTVDTLFDLHHLPRKEPESVLAAMRSRWPLAYPPIHARTAGMFTSYPRWLDAPTLPILAAVQERGHSSSVSVRRLLPHASPAPDPQRVLFAQFEHGEHPSVASLLWQGPSDPTQVFHIRLQHVPQRSHPDCPLLAHPSTRLALDALPWHPFLQLSAHNQSLHQVPLRLRVAPLPILEASASTYFHTANLTIALVADPRCHFAPRVQIDWLRTLGATLRAHAGLLPAFSFALVLLAFAWQLREHQIAAIFPSTHAALIRAALLLIPVSPLLAHPVLFADLPATHHPDAPTLLLFAILAAGFTLLLHAVVRLLTWLLSWPHWLYYLLTRAGRARVKARPSRRPLLTYAIQAAVVIALVSSSHAGLVLAGFVLLLLWHAANARAHRATRHDDLDISSDHILDILRRRRDRDAVPANETNDGGDDDDDLVGLTRLRIIHSRQHFREAVALVYLICWITVAPNTAAWIRAVIEQNRFVVDMPDPWFLYLIPMLVHILTLLSDSDVPQRGLAPWSWLAILCALCALPLALVRVYHLPPVLTLWSLAGLWSSLFSRVAMRPSNKQKPE